MYGFHLTAASVLFSWIYLAALQILCDCSFASLFGRCFCWNIDQVPLHRKHINISLNCCYKCLALFRFVVSSCHAFCLSLFFYFSEIKFIILFGIWCPKSTHTHTPPPDCTTLQCSLCNGFAATQIELGWYMVIFAFFVCRPSTFTFAQAQWERERERLHY